MEEYLKKAYAEYTAKETGPTFRCYLLSQEIFSTASNEVVIYCTTTVSLPLGQGAYDEYSLTRAFDKKSGDPIGSWDLFAMTEDEVKTALLSDYATDSETLKILCADFLPEYIRFYPDGYEIIFPYETSVHLAAKDTASPSNIGFSNNYTDSVQSVLKMWVIPD